MSTGVDVKTAPQPEEVEAARTSINHDFDLDEKATAAEYKADAIEAENAEYAMGVWEAVKAYPMASFWAFIISFTIVSYHFSQFDPKIHG